MKICTCGLAIRMNSTVAAAALKELRKHDSKAADQIVAMVNQKVHRDWCGSADKWRKGGRPRNPSPRRYCAGCEASVTSTDIVAGFCTNCNMPLGTEGGKKR
jgi:hypothetical protein